MKQKQNFRITESELILPALMVLNNTEEGKMSTSSLISCLRSLLRPSGKDLDILVGRHDDKFSQKVRNLVSHDTLGRDNYATHKYGVFRITDHGRDYLREKQDIVRYLITNDFDWKDLKKGFKEIERNKAKKVETFDENVIINEGFKKSVRVNYFERSTRLRNAAIKAFTKNGMIKCDCCNFNFEEFYGKKIGKGFIEIHHIKPIFKYEDQELKQFIKDALKNLIPVCSNCHRMIHRIWKQPLEIEDLIRHIKKNSNPSLKRTELK